LEKVTLLTSNCSEAMETTMYLHARLKTLVFSTLLITASASTVRDYIQETYSELELQVFPHYADMFPSSQYIRTSLSRGQSSLCPYLEVIFLFRIVWENVF
jgi:hypothetical protein